MKLPKIGKLTVLHRNHIGGSFFVLFRIYQRCGFFRLSLSLLFVTVPATVRSGIFLPASFQILYHYGTFSCLCPYWSTFCWTISCLCEHFVTEMGIASCLDPQIITGWQIFLSLSALCDIFSCLHPAHLFRTFSCLWPNLYILQISFLFYDLQ